MGWIEQRRNLWVPYYRDEMGTKHRAGPGQTSKRQAKALADAKTSEVRLGTHQDPRAGRVTFAEYVEGTWLPNKLGEVATVRKYRSHYNATLEPRFGSTELRRITRPVVQGWITDMTNAGVSPVSIEAKVIALQAILAGRRGSSALRDGLIFTNPVEGVQLPKVDRRKVSVYSTAEVDALIAALPPWCRPLVLLAAESGLRWGELLGLRVADFTDGCLAVRVERTIVEVAKADTTSATPFMWKARTKSGRARFVALSTDAADAMCRLIRDRHLFGQDRVFSMEDPGQPGMPLRTPEWPDGQPIGRTHQHDVWRRAHLTAGVEKDGRRFHDLRGSHVSWLLAGGADLATVMQRVGHQQLGTTQRCLAALQDADRRALDALATTRARYRVV